MSDQNGHKPKRNGSRKGKGNIDIERKAEMVAALPLVNGCKSEVARQFGVAESTVRAAEKDPQVRELCEVKKEEIAAGFRSLTQKLLKRYSDLADTATLTDKGVVLLGICADKALLYAGEPNSITENRNDAAQRDEALKALAEMVTACNGDEAKAKALFTEHAPTLSRWIN